MKTLLFVHPAVRLHHQTLPLTASPRDLGEDQDLEIWTKIGARDLGTRMRKRGGNLELGI